VRLKRLVNDPNADWERLAAREPYWAVLTDDKYRSSTITEGALQEFFASGESHVALLFEVVRTRLDPTFAPERALDYGCGVGRVAIPLGKVCREVVAVDVAPTMLAQARRHAAAQGVSNVDFVLSDDELSGVSGSFDFVHSYIVLQHLPPARGEKIAERVVALLAANGIGALHLSYHVPMSRFQRAKRRARQSVPLANAAANLLRGRSPSHPCMQMNEYSLTRMLDILRRTGCHDVHLRFTDHGGALGAFLFFRKSPAKTF
jgi:2-polyprenyl-3-methyl-5-hydroxy-6-metoxy-1,4-benzoquinol methylase